VLVSLARTTITNLTIRKPPWRRHRTEEPFNPCNIEVERFVSDCIPILNRRLEREVASMKLYVLLGEMSHPCEIFRICQSESARHEKEPFASRSAFRAELVCGSAHNDVSHFRHYFPLSGRSLCLKVNLARLGWLSTRSTFSTT
jgi:hypothetical protein